MAAAGGVRYGLAMTGNWAMIGFFPLFVIALVWIKGLSFFNLRFLGMMAICGLFGLILYLLLPLTQMHGDFVQVPFWAALKKNIGAQKGIVGLFLNKNAILHGDKPLWVLSLFALVPVLLIAIRWPSYFGDTSRMGVGHSDLDLKLALRSVPAGVHLGRSRPRNESTQLSRRHAAITHILLPGGDLRWVFYRLLSARLWHGCRAFTTCSVIFARD